MQAADRAALEAVVQLEHYAREIKGHSAIAAAKTRQQTRAFSEAFKDNVKGVAVVKLAGALKTAGDALGLSVEDLATHVNQSLVEQIAAAEASLVRSYQKARRLASRGIEEVGRKVDENEAEVRQLLRRDDDAKFWLYAGHVTLTS